MVGRRSPSCRTSASRTGPPWPWSASSAAASAGLVGGTFRQLRETLREARSYPQTLLFLGAYVLFNDGVQTVIAVSSIYGSVELGFATDQLIVVIVVVQAVAFAGALLFGRIAGTLGAKRTILVSLCVWVAVVGAAYTLPAGEFGLFVALGAGIGLVLGRHPGAQPLAVQPARPARASRRSTSASTRPPSAGPRGSGRSPSGSSSSSRAPSG